MSRLNQVAGIIANAFLLLLSDIGGCFRICVIC